MINVKVSDKEEISVSFSHSSKGTVCRIMTGPIGSKYEDKTIISEGKVNKYVRDTPNKAIGRKLALTKALNKTEDMQGIAYEYVRKIIDKPTRELIWNAYADKLGPNYNNDMVTKVKVPSIIAQRLEMIDALLETVNSIAVAKGEEHAN